MSGTSPSPSAGYALSYEPSLDGLRAVAIVAVVLFHASATSGHAAWFRGGFIGVSVFFTLSGFLITSVLLRELDRTDGIDAGRFWSRRIKRLIPAQMVTIVAVMVVTWLGWFETRRADVIAAAWSVTNWHIIAAGPDKVLQTVLGPLGPTWSLAIEEQFYVVLLAVVLVVVAATPRPARTLAWVAGVTVIGSVVAQFLSGEWTPRAEFGLDTRAGELAVGVGLAVAMHRGWSILTDRSEATTRRYDLIALVGIVAIGVGALTFTYDPPWLLRGGYVIVALVTAATIAGLLGGRRVRSALSFAPVVWCGQLSYSWYLIHWPVILLLSPTRTGLDGVSLIALKVVISLIVATALSYGVERPIRQRDAPAARFAVAAWIASAAAVSVAAWATLAS